nr:YggN family protein [Pseudoxanthomonas sp. PXM02]
MKLNASGHPRAEVSAKGDFIVDGKPVPLTDEQRALLVAYHRQLGGIAEAGIATGKEGAKLAGKAVGAAVRGIFSGDPDRIDREMDAEAKKVEAEAMKICDHLPGLYKAQQDLVAALPAFQPYAGMKPADVEECRSSHDESYEAGKNVGRVVGQAVKATQGNAAQEADAAAAEPAPAPAPTP